MRSHWIKVHLNSTMGILLSGKFGCRDRRTGECHMTMEAEVGVCLYKPRKPRSTSKEAGRALRSSLQGQQGLARRDVRHPGCRTVRARVAVSNHWCAGLCYSSPKELTHPGSSRALCIAQLSVKLLASSNSYHGPFRKVCIRSNSRWVTCGLTSQKCS